MFMYDTVINTVTKAVAGLSNGRVIDQKLRRGEAPSMSNTTVAEEQYTWPAPWVEADPNFQSALSRVSTRVGTNLGLDAVDLALNKLAANPATAAVVPRLRERLASARSTIARASNR